MRRDARFTCDPSAIGPSVTISVPLAIERPRLGAAARPELAREAALGGPLWISLISWLGGACAQQDRIDVVLKKELQDRLASAAAGGSATWPAVIADLGSLTETEVKQDGERFLLRSDRALPPPSRSPLSAFSLLRQIANA